MLSNNERRTVSITEKGTWVLCEVIGGRWIEKTRCTDTPQFVLPIRQEDGRESSLWIPEKVSRRSKYYSLLTALTGNFLLTQEDRIVPESFFGRLFLGLWGVERGPKGFVDAFVYFLPSPQSGFESASSHSE